MITTHPEPVPSSARVDVDAPRPRVAPAAPTTGFALRPAGESGRECEKLGLVEAVLYRERYASILEIGCGTGELAHLLAERCASYTGMDTDMSALAAARCRIVAGSPMRFVPLLPSSPFPRGEHELVVLSEVLHLLDPDGVRHFAERLAGHAPCREIVVVGARDDHAGEDDPVLDAFVDALGGAFRREELAVRRHYRLDALLR